MKKTTKLLMTLAIGTILFIAGCVTSSGTSTSYLLDGTVMKCITVTKHNFWDSNAGDTDEVCYAVEEDE